ncbi:MAG: hypothetical protein H6656_05080 [Ardenticatenaceae bacterium]|nr:hypothetical protein [Ardenticatenaceae bacterium]
MKKWRQWLENLSAEETLWLTAVFLSAMLGTMVSSAILQWGLSTYHGVVAKLVICLLATSAYGGAVISVFYALFPETRLALKRIFSHKK